jgi:hypothetical protein
MVGRASESNRLATAAGQKSPTCRRSPVRGPVWCDPCDDSSSVGDAISDEGIIVGLAGRKKPGLATSIGTAFRNMQDGVGLGIHP